jgi:Family of unknown function (DUF6069)
VSADPLLELEILMSDVVHETKSAGSPAERARPFSPGRLAVATLAAGLLNLGVCAVGVAAGASMRVDTPTLDEVTPALAVVTTVLLLGVAGVVVWFAARRWPALGGSAAWLGLGFALLATVGPLLVGQDLPTKLALTTMHVVAGVAWFVGVGVRR